jgi:uncharacterized membrane protein
MKTQVEKVLAVSLIASIYFNMLLVAAKELVPGLKQLMKTYLFHHWLGHGVLVLLFFGMCSWLLSKTKINPNTQKVPFYIVSGIIVSTLGITVFYISHVH